MKKTPGNIILQQCTINDNHMMYGSWDKMSFWAIFCCFTPLTTQEIKILKKWKKTPGDIIILHKCTKNHDHRLYCSWDMAHGRYNCYFSFWVIFCPFTPLTAQKMKISKKITKCLEISSFYTSVPKIMIICCTVPEIWRVADVIVIFHFVLYFALLPPHSLKNRNLNEMKKYLKISSFYTSVPWHDVWFLRYDRQNFLSFWVIFCHVTPLTTQKIKILRKWWKCLKISSFYTSVPKIMTIC